ncbi:TetR family transcriptional regulator [Oscillospiraceae bacterium PP1C4]
MPRRSIPNLQETIITETIKIGAKDGANKVSTIKLAKKCGITEPAIYGRFKKKFDLLFAAYIHINEQIDMLLREIDWENISTLKDVKDLWYKLFNYAISNPEYTNYFQSFRRTTNHDSSILNEHRELYVKYAKIIMAINLNKKQISDIEYLKIWVNWVNVSLKLAQMISDGILPLDERTKDLLFKLIFGENLEM